MASFGLFVMIPLRGLQFRYYSPFRTHALGASLLCSPRDSFTSCSLAGTS